MRVFLSPLFTVLMYCLLYLSETEPLNHSAGLNGTRIETTNTNITISDLVPYIQYTFSVAAETNAGISDQPVYITVATGKKKISTIFEEV